MKKSIKLLLSLVILFSSSIVLGQGKYDYLRLGDNEFDAKNYYTAAQYYQRVFDQYADSNTTAFPYSHYNTLNTTKYIDQYFEVMNKLADAYRLYNDYRNAEKWYAKVNLLAVEQFPLSRLWYGVSLRANGKYDEALKQLSAFRLLYNQKDENARIADLEIEKCNFAINALKNPISASVDRLDSLSINGRGSNFGSGMYKNDSSLVFTSSRRILASSVAGQNLAPLVAKDLGTSGDEAAVEPNTAPSDPETLSQEAGSDSLGSVVAGDDIPGKKGKAKKEKKAKVKKEKVSKKKDTEAVPAADDKAADAAKADAKTDDTKPVGKDKKEAKPVKEKKEKKPKKAKKSKNAIDVPVLTQDTIPADSVAAPAPVKKDSVEVSRATGDKLNEVLAPPSISEKENKKKGFLFFGKGDKKKDAKKDSAEASAKVVKPKKKKKPYNPPVIDEEEFFNQLYTTEKGDSSQWTIPQALVFEESTEKKGFFSSRKEEKMNQGTPSFTKDRKTVYFTQWSGMEVRKPVFHIYRSTQYESGLWSAPMKVKLPIHEQGARYMHPCITQDGKRLFFTSDKTGGFGKLDIWYANIDTAGVISEPINAGSKVNTKDDDVSPFYSDSLKSLFFASQGRLGLGGLDLFKSDYIDSKFDTSVNLGYPINSSKDDAFLVVTVGDTTRGYFSSDRASDCCYELYMFDYVYGFIRGRIIDNETKLPIPGVPVRLIDNDTNQELQKVFTDNDGYYYFKVAPNKIYKILAGDEGQLKDSRKVNTKGLKDGQIIDLSQLELNKLVLDKPIEIKNIYYDFDKATLRKESESVLDNLANFLSENPNVVVEIGSHTDDRGTEEYNQDLSNRRSEVVVNYLIYKGIPSRLLKFKGYGESRPIAANENADRTDNEAGRQLNRRTEFKVVEILK